MKFRTGIDLPRLGQGTWRMGEDPARRDAEIASLRLGLDQGMRLIDTAEMYGGGGAESIVAEAIEGRREEVILVSKVLPQNASREGTVRAAERSLKRLGTDRIDLYLLHWPGEHPLYETLAGFLDLVEQGKILHFGVSNFDTDALKAAEQLPEGAGIASNQVLYNLERRGIERRLLPWCRDKNVNVMAYSPYEQGHLASRGLLRGIAQRLGCKPYQVALAWTIRKPGVTAIPKAVHPAHVLENAAAERIRLADEDLAELDRAFRAPRKEVPLDVL